MIEVTLHPIKALVSSDKKSVAGPHQLPANNSQGVPIKKKCECIFQEIENDFSLIGEFDWFVIYMDGFEYDRGGTFELYCNEMETVVSGCD